MNFNMDEDHFNSLLQMLRSKNDGDIKLAQNIIKNFEFVGERKMKKKHRLEKRFCKELGIKPCVDCQELYVFQNYWYSNKKI